MSKKLLRLITIGICVVMLMSIGFLSGCTEKSYARKLCNAIDNDDLDELVRLLEEGGNVNSKTHTSLSSVFGTNNMPPLLYACWNGKFDAVMVLLEYGADPNIEKEWESALVLCSYNGKPEDSEKMLLAVNTLIQYGADVNYRNHDVAVLCGMAGLLPSRNRYSNETIFAVLKLLVDSGADFEKACSNKKSILLFDFSYKNDDFIGYLINEKDANIIVFDDKNNTPLIFATRAGSVKSVSLLLEHGIDKNHKNNEGKTALDYAIEKGYTEIITLLS